MLRKNLLEGLGLLRSVSRGEPVRVRLDRQSKKRGHKIPITLRRVVPPAQDLNVLERRRSTLAFGSDVIRRQVIGLLATWMRAERVCCDRLPGEPEPSIVVAALSPRTPLALVLPPAIKALTPARVGHVRSALGTEAD
jgi:hypothetical protein